ncbi:MAG: hypothetical protein LBE36_09495 [Flavobacteriaceae bacterium]|jgi:hypothetical protein|nr:hypothetical protein [Flavobacteriaceae bacterium]
MNTIIKKVLFSGLIAVVTVAIFSLSVRDSSLESLKANAAGRTACLPSEGVDCAGTGGIYINYKRVAIIPR